MWIHKVRMSLLMLFVAVVALEFSFFAIDFCKINDLTSESTPANLDRSSLLQHPISPSRQLYFLLNRANLFMDDTSFSHALHERSQDFLPITI